MKAAQFVWGTIFVLLIVGMVLRYGNSSHLLASDFNSLLKTVSLQNANLAYYGPQ